MAVLISSNNWAAWLTVVVALSFAGRAAGGESATSQPAGDLTSMSLEDLMKIEVTTVSKRKQSIGDAPAAITVIGQDDIQRSGMTTIPDLLRLVPGMDVARYNASTWAVGSRGFNDIHTNKLLVLVDGRTVFGSTFGGVSWGTEDYMLQDLERIEVVRGPGATLWGSTAVNGVVNIVSKSSKDTQGWLVTGLGGNQQQEGAIRFGGKIDEETSFRVYTKYRNFGDEQTPAGRSAEDGWQSVQGGFRIDRESGNDKLTLQGDVYSQQLSLSETAPLLMPPYQSFINKTFDADGGNVLGRWTHTISSTSDLSVQMYYDRSDHYETYVPIQQNEFNLEFQHRFELTQRQELIWGLQYRAIRDRVEAHRGYVMSPSAKALQFTSGFVQDDVTIIPEHLHFIAGTKLEYDPYVNFQVQPGARLLFTPDKKNTVWASVSRALTTPARYEEDLKTVFSAFPTPAGLATAGTIGTHGLSPEELMAYEVGYRFSPIKRLSVDLSLFYDDYDHLTGTQSLTPTFVSTPSPHLFIPVGWTNNLEAQSYGGELAATWNVTDKWRLTGSYSFLSMHVSVNGPDNGGRGGFDRGASPEHQAQLRSYYNLTRNLQLNTAIFYVSPLSEGHIPAQLRVDANIDWQIRDNLDLMVGVQNLIDNHHPEFPGTHSYFVPTELPRTFFAELTYRF
jgi:iron complex outermembrane receptor protein